MEDVIARCTSMSMTKTTSKAMAAVLSTSASHRRSWLMRSLAATLALAVGLGSGVWLSQSSWFSVYLEHDRGDVIAKAGYRAHKIFTAEVRHPVEVDAADKNYLLSWLSQRIGTPLRIPDLSEQGLKLLGGRLLPVEGHPAAQLMYENAHGDRHTLFITKSDGAPPIDFHFEEWGSIGCYYWIDGDLGYALNGPKDRTKLMAIATKAYEQTS